MGDFISLSLVLVLGFLSIGIRCSSYPNLSYIESERMALLTFKQSLEDPMNQLSSWEGNYYCNWQGVECQNRTAFVSRLNLSGKSLSGEINTSLLALKHLSHLDLSLNDFSGRIIPGFVGELTELEYLNLSNANFAGRVPHQLGKLSSLLYLDLGSNDSISIHRLYDDDLSWISYLYLLRYLDMGMVDLSKATNWLIEISKLPSLSVLKLFSCGLSTIPQSLPYLNLTSLGVLDLSSNNISSLLPNWLFNMSSLRIIDISGNQLEGNIPRTTGGALCNLQFLDLSSNNITGGMTGLIDALSLCNPDQVPKLTVLNLAHNSLSGNIPLSTEKLSSLEVLYLQSNELSGDLPKCLGQLQRLAVLNVSSNFLTGVVSEAHFANLSRLKELYMSFNNLSLMVSSNWIPPFQLNHIYMSSCQLGPSFPSWLHTQNGFSNLDISNAGISDAIPDWFWLLTNEIVYLNLSFNQINGMLPLSMESISIIFMDLSSNQFEGPIPKLHPDIQMLHLNDNSFEGTLPSDIGHKMPMLRSLQISNNILNGSIPESLCDLKQLLVLWLAGNHLTGRIPDCWSKVESLQIMDIGTNNLSGTIPTSIGSLNSLVSLHLNANNLTGEIPASLKNCTHLTVLELSDNHLSGSIPAWIGESLQDLIILRLRSNNFVGRIPDELPYLPSVHVFDISINSLSGTIPRSLGSLTSMIEVQNSGGHLRETWNGYKEHVMVCINGRQFAYSKTLAFVTNLDLSSNKLVGEIPDEVTNLLGLLVLNLSNNRLTGEIPQKIGDLTRLLSLDLSRNSLSGQIPSSMSDLTSLNHLNLSHNRLTGEIPSGFQLQTLDDPSIYIGNEGLCGPPLTDECEVDDKPTSSYAVGSDEDGSKMQWFYSGVPAGFVFGLVVVFGVLLLQETWRIAFFQLIDTMYDWLDETIFFSIQTFITQLKRTRLP